MSLFKILTTFLVVNLLSIVYGDNCNTLFEQNSEKIISNIVNQIISNLLTEPGNELKTLKVIRISKDSVLAQFKPWYLEEVIKDAESLFQNNEILTSEYREAAYYESLKLFQKNYPNLELNTKVGIENFKRLYIYELTSQKPQEEVYDLLIENAVNSSLKYLEETSNLNPEMLAVSIEEQLLIIEDKLFLNLRNKVISRIILTTIRTALINYYILKNDESMDSENEKIKAILNQKPVFFFEKKAMDNIALIIEEVNNNQNSSGIILQNLQDDLRSNHMLNFSHILQDIQGRIGEKNIASIRHDLDEVQSSFDFFLGKKYPNLLDSDFIESAYLGPILVYMRGLSTFNGFVDILKTKFDNSFTRKKEEGGIFLDIFATSFKEKLIMYFVVMELFPVQGLMAERAQVDEIVGLTTHLTGNPNFSNQSSVPKEYIINIAEALKETFQRINREDQFRSDN